MSWKLVKNDDRVKKFVARFRAKLVHTDLGTNCMFRSSYYLKSVRVETSEKHDLVFEHSDFKMKHLVPIELVMVEADFKNERFHQDSLYHYPMLAIQIGDFLKWSFVNMESKDQVSEIRKVEQPQNLNLSKSNQIYGLCNFHISQMIWYNQECKINNLKLGQFCSLYIFFDPHYFLYKQEVNMIAIEAFWNNRIRTNYFANTLYNEFANPRVDKEEIKTIVFDKPKSIFEIVKEYVEHNPREIGLLKPFTRKLTKHEQELLDTTYKPVVLKSLQMVNNQEYYGWRLRNVSVLRWYPDDEYSLPWLVRDQKTAFFADKCKYRARKSKKKMTEKAAIRMKYGTYRRRSSYNMASLLDEIKKSKKDLHKRARDYDDELT
jgi:hypothetical protein